MSKPINWVSKIDTRKSHKVAVLVEVLSPQPWSQATPIRELWEVVDGSVSLDATAEARGRVALTLPATPDLIPTSPSDLLAPFGNEIRVSRGIDYGSHVDLIQLGIFRIDSCSVSGNTIQLDGLDRTAMFIDARFEEPNQYPAGIKITDMIVDVLVQGAYNIGFATDFLDRMEFDGLTPQAINFHEEEDRWGFAQSAATAIGGELYFDSRGVLVLRAIPSDHGDADSGTYAEGPGGVLMSAGRNFSRTTVCNKVIVSGENSSDDIIARWYAVDDNPNSPTYYYGRFGRKPMFTTNSFVIDNEMARNMAQGILNRSKGAPDSIEFEAVVNPALRPSDTVFIKRERLGLNMEKHVIDAVDIPLSPGGTMRCRTRAIEVIT